LTLLSGVPLQGAGIRGSARLATGVKRILPDARHNPAATVDVEQNPLRAALVKTAGQWHWSSARAHLSNSDGNWLDFTTWRLCTSPGFWQSALARGLQDASLLQRIREATRHGRPIGDEPFTEKIGRELNLDMHPGPKGRPILRADAACSAIRATIAGVARLIHPILLLLAAASSAPADSRNQVFSDFTMPMPVKSGETLILGIVGGWERWDNPARCIRRTAIVLKRKKLAGVHVETVENHKLELAHELVKKAFDFDQNGELSREEAARANIILFGQSLGGRAVLYLARTLHEWGVPVRLAFVIDGYGRDSYAVPPNVAAAANIFQRDQLILKGAAELRPEDPSSTRILLNRRVSYKGRAHTIDTSDDVARHRFFMGAHTLMEHDPEVWDEVIARILEAIPARD
jgi:hypothetical protein